MFDHERVIIERGARSRLPIIVAVHSTVLGPATGGCRVWQYPSWRDGLDDALRLSTSMTIKCAAAGLPYGGGKTVVALPVGRQLDASARRDLLHDVGDVIESLGGTYITGPDVGTAPTDMVTMGERTRFVCCRPESAGGSGDSSPHTAAGVVAAIEATCRQLFGSDDLGDRSISIVGLGNVGGDLARRLAEAGARLTVTDIDPSRRGLAGKLGASWVGLDAAVTAEVDVLVPAALGGLLTADLVPRLRCRAIVGPANNQLAAMSVADDLLERGICLVPDYVASAGGVIYAVMRELRGVSVEEASARVRGIGETVAEILAAAARSGGTPHDAARRLALARLRQDEPVVAV
jgi:glutamate dehydrogenase/leucine dehydrogenase